MIPIASFPIAWLLFLLLVAALLIAAFWLVRNFVTPLIKSRKASRLTASWLFRLELLCWLSYVVFALYLFLLLSPVITVIFLGLILLLAWPFFKDFVPGLLLRLENQITRGDIIRFQGQESSVETIGLRNLSSSNAAGETIITPYHKLNNAIIVRARAAGKLVKHSFTLRLPEEDPLKATAQITKYFLECPWSASLQAPAVKMLESGEYQVTAHAADKLAAEKQKAYINWRLSQG